MHKTLLGLTALLCIPLIGCSADDSSIISSTSIPEVIIVKLYQVFKIYEDPTNEESDFIMGNPTLTNTYKYDYGTIIDLNNVHKSPEYPYPNCDENGTCYCYHLYSKLTYDIDLKNRYDSTIPLTEDLNLYYYVFV